MAEEIGIVISLEGAKQFVSDLLSAQAGLDTLGKFLTDAVGQLGALDSAVKAQSGTQILEGTNFGQLNAQLNTTTEEIAGLYQRLQGVEALFDKNKASVDSLKASLGGVAASTSETASNLTDTAQAAAQASQSVDSLNAESAELRETGSAAQAAAQGFESINTATDKIGGGSGTDALQKSLSGLAPLIDDLLSFSDAYEVLGSSISQYPNIWKDIGNLFSAFENVNTSDIKATGSALGGISAFLTHLNNLPGIAANIEQAKGVADFINTLAGVRPSNIVKIADSGQKLIDFVAQITQINGSQLTIFNQVVESLSKVNAVKIDASLATSLTTLGKALGTFTKSISDKASASSIQRTIDSFDAIGLFAKKLAEVEATFTVSGNQVTQSFIEFASDLAKAISAITITFSTIANIDPAEVTTATRAIATSLKRIDELFAGQNIQSGKFAQDITVVAGALKVLSEALSFIGRSKTVAKFNTEIGTLIASLNRLATEVNVAAFLKTIQPFSATIAQLTISIKGLVDLGGKSFIGKEQTKQIEQLRFANTKLRADITEANSIRVEEHILLREELRLKRKAEAATAALANAQAKANKSFAFDALSQSNNLLDRFISKLYEADSVNPEINIRLKIFGIKAFTGLISALVTFPYKVIKLITSAFGQLVSIIGKLGFNVLAGGARILANVFSTLGSAAFHLIGYIGKLAVALLKLPFKVIGTIAQVFGNVLSGVVKFVFGLITAFAKLFVWSVKLITKVTLITALFKVVTVPVRLLTAAILGLVAAFTKLGSRSKSNDLDKTSQDMRELDAATEQTADSQNKLQVELSETDKELLSTQTNATKTTAAIAGMGLAASAINMAKTFATGKTIANSLKQILAFTVAFKALQKVGQLFNRTFQQVRFYLTQLGRDAIEAATEYEALTLSLTALTKLEFKELGLATEIQAATAAADNFNTDNFTDSLDSLRSMTLDDVELEATVKANIDVNSFSDSLDSLNRLTPEQVTIDLKANIDTNDFSTTLQQLNTSSLDSARSQMNAYGNSIDLVGQKVQETLRWIRNLAIQSPFEEGDVAEVYRFGLSMGFTSMEMESLTERLLDFGAATAATPDQLKSAVRALGQMRTSVSLTKEDLNQLLNAGYRNPLQTLVDAIPNLETTADVLQAITDKTIDGATAVKIFSDRMAADFAGSAIQATKTLGGLISTMQSLRKTMLVSFTAPVFDILKPIVASLLGTDQINELLQRAEQLGEVFAGYLTEAALKVAHAIGLILGVFEAIPGPMKAALVQFVKFAAIVLATFVALTALKVAVGAIFLTLGLLLNPLSLAIAVMVGFSASIISLAKSVRTQFQGMGASFSSFYSVIEPGLNAVGNLFHSVFSNIATFLGNFVNTVFNYGVNIGVSLANGIAAAASAVIGAVMQIAGVIAQWLQPGSPPKALPKIDEWGTAAANEFLGGFSSADFSLISDFGSTLADLVEALELPEGTLDVNDLQQDLANLIEGINNGLDDSAIDEFFREVQKEAGEFNEDVANVAKEFAALAQEQAKLTKITDEYNLSLSNTNSELDEISRQQIYASQQKELESLDRKLASSAFTAEQKAALELERNKILATQRKAEIEEQQDAVDEQKARIALLKERIGLDKELADGEDPLAASGVGGGASSALDKLSKTKLDKVTDGLLEGLEGLIDPAENIQSALSEIEIPELNFGQIIQDAKDQIGTKVDGIKDKFDELGVTMGTVKTIALGLGAVLLFPLVASRIGALITLFGGLATVLAPFALAGVGAAVAIGLIGGALVLFSDKITPQLLTNISNGIQNLGTSITTFFTSLRDGLSGSSEADSESFSSLIDNIATSIESGDPATIGESVGNVLGAFREDLITQLTALQTTITDAVTTYIVEPFMAAFAIEDDPMFETRTLVERLRDGLVASLTSVGLEIKTAVEDFVTNSITTPFTTAFDGAGGGEDGTAGFAEKLLSGLVAVFTSLVTPVAEAVTTFLADAFDIDFTTITETLKTNIKQPFIDAFDSIELDSASLSDKLEAGLLAAISGISISLAEVFNLPEVGPIQSIKDALTGIKDAIPANILLTFTNIFERFADNVEESDLGPKLLEMALSLGELALKVGAVVAALAGIVALGIFTVLAEIPTLLAGVADIITGISEVLNGFADAVVAVFTLDGEALSASLTRIAGGFETFSDGVSGIIQGLLDIVTGLFQALLNIAGIDAPILIENMQLMSDGITKLFVLFSETVIINPFTAIAGVIEGFPALIELAKTSFDSIVEAFTVTVGNPFEGFVAVITNIASEEGPVEILKTALAELVTFISELLFSNPFALLEGFVTLFLPALGLIETGFTLLQTYINTWTTNNPFSPLTTIINAVKTNISSIKDVFTDVKTFLENLIFKIPGLESARDALADFTNSLPDFITSRTTGASSETDVVEPIIDGINTDLDNATITGTPTLDITLDDNTDQIITELGVAGELSGDAYVAGINAGIEAAEPDTKAGVETAADNIGSWFKDRLGIESPSTVANEEIGIPIAEGIIEGIETGLADDESVGTLGQTFAQSFITSFQSAFIGVDLITPILAGVSGSTDGATSLFAIDQATVTTFVQTFTGVYAAILEALEEFVSEYMDTFEEFIEDITEMLNEYVEATLKVVEEMLDEIIGMLVAFAVNVISILDSLLSRVEKLMERFVTIMRDAARDAIEAFIEELENLEGQVLSAMDTMLSNLQEDLGDKFYDLGYALGVFYAQGIIQALSDYADELTAAGEAAGQAVADGTTQSLNISSPSKVAYRLGKFYVAGLVNSIKDSLGDAYSSGVALADRLSNGAQQAANKVRLAPITVPVQAKYIGLKDSLPTLQQQITATGSRPTDIASMRAMSNANIITTNNNYSLNMTVRESQAPKVSRSFNRMQQLRV